MKKFLVFLVSIIVVICLGMTFYYFAKDEEVIKFNTSTVYINAGESISLEDLGFSHTGKKKETKINFNAADDSSKSIISYNSSLGRYVSTTKGGNATIVITTNNYKFKRFEIKVTVGNGSKETPYQIYSEDDLFAIGTSKFDTTPDNGENEALTAHYVLMNDIVVTTPHLPIGRTEDDCDNFDGYFNGNYYTIHNLQNQANEYGGLFAVLGNKSTVVNLNLKNANISGSFDYAGVLAGVANGYIDRIQVLDSTVNNTKSGSTTGGLAGKIETSIVGDETNIATVYRVAIESTNKNNITGTTYVGGIAGQIIKANLEGIKTSTTITSTSKASAYAGGFAGKIELDTFNGYVRESYSLSNVVANSSNATKGALFGAIQFDDIAENNSLLGLYFDGTKTGCDYEYGYGVASGDISSLDNASKNTTELTQNSTYIFYYDDDHNPVSWRTSVWKLVDGQYPVLRYLENAIPDNIDTTPSNPSDPVDPIIPIDPITPDDPDDSDIIEISSKDDLLQITSFVAGKTYKIMSDIDLGGTTWTAKQLKQANFVAESPKTISNFKITSSTNYCGFFSSIVNGSVENITFSNAKVENSSTKYQYVGIVAGVVNAGYISNVDVTGAKINLTYSTYHPDYVGGLVGACENSYNTITNCSVSADIDGQIKNAGGFVGMTGANTKIDNSTFVGRLTASEYLGGFVAENSGVITDSNAEVELEVSSTSSKNSYVGGFIGPNFNTVENCQLVLVNISINNYDNLHTIYVGGFAAYSGSSNTIANCVVKGKTTSSSIKIVANNGTINLGGFVSYNLGTILNCKNELTGIGAEMTGVYAGGIVCHNQNGTIENCVAYSNVYGDRVGGIAYNTTGNSIIRTSSIGYDQRVLLKGNYVAGLSCYLAGGDVSDCLILTTSYGLSSQSILGGVVLDFPVSTNGRYATVEHCIISNEFAGLGDKYLLTPAAIFASNRSTGTIKNCIIDTSCTGTTGANEPSYDKNLFNQTKPAASNSNYTKANSTTLYQIATYTNCGFKIATDKSTTWYYVSSGNNIPRIVNLEK